MSSVYQPYTYLIGWYIPEIGLDYWYYGVRYSKNCSPADLWTIYFTSSVYIKLMRLWHGEPNFIQVRRVFRTKGQALRCEEKVLKKINAAKNQKWLNKQNGAKNFIPPEITQEIKNKIAATLKNRLFTEEHRRKLQIAATGKSKSPQSTKKRAKSYIVANPQGNYFSIHNLTRFCKANNLNVAHMSSVSNYNRPHHKGWMCYSLQNFKSPVPS